MNFFHRIRSLVLKELQSLFGDPSSRALLIMPVLLQTLVTGRDKLEKSPDRLEK